MNENKELVRLVQYMFNPDDLFVDLSDLSRYKADECIQEYRRLCQEELQHFYPEAEVLVDEASFAEIYTESLRNTADDLDDTFEQAPAPEEYETIESICSRVFEAQKWIVLRRIMPIKEAKNHAKIPLPAIRWVCKEGLIEGASNSTGRWDIDFDEISQIYQHIQHIESASELKNVIAKNIAGVAYLKDLADVAVVNIPEGIKVLVATKKGFDKKLFKGDNTLCHIRKDKGQLELKIEHFIDTIGWSGWKWSYQEWTTELQKQATRKKISSEIQVTNEDEVDGISFVWNVEVRLDKTIQTVIQDALRELKYIIDDADLALQGGPVWDDEADKIYQKDEVSFQKEILLPLLRKMYEGRVFYTHSSRGEHGRDFVFTEITKFQETLYYGLQAKAGNISGGANKDIDTLVVQIKRAFIMPLNLDVRRREDYISVMIIATSGDFTQDAKDVMRQEIPKRLVGSVYFWNKEKILALINEHWRKEQD